MVKRSFWPRLRILGYSRTGDKDTNLLAIFKIGLPILEINYQIGEDELSFLRRFPRPHKERRLEMIIEKWNTDKKITGGRVILPSLWLREWDW